MKYTITAMEKKKNPTVRPEENLLYYLKCFFLIQGKANYRCIHMLFIYLFIQPYTNQDSTIDKL